MLNRSLRLAILALCLVANACSTTAKQALPPPETVNDVDLYRYAGTWFEIAALPQRFESDCFATTARYGLDGDGNLTVVNRCREDAFDGPEKIASGEVRVMDKQTNSKLAVSYLWPFWTDYWIIDLDPYYRWVVVAHPSRDALWVFSRTPTLDQATYDGIVERAREQGYDISRLRVTPQKP